MGSFSTRNDETAETVVTQQQNLPLNHNLGAELDDDTHVAQFQKKETQTSSTSTKPKCKSKH